MGYVFEYEKRPLTRGLLVPSGSIPVSAPSEYRFQFLNSLQKRCNWIPVSSRFLTYIFADGSNDRAKRAVVQRQNGVKSCAE